MRAGSKFINKYYMCFDERDLRSCLLDGFLAGSRICNAFATSSSNRVGCPIGVTTSIYSLFKAARLIQINFSIIAKLEPWKFIRSVTGNSVLWSIKYHISNRDFIWSENVDVLSLDIDCHGWTRSFRSILNSLLWAIIELFSLLDGEIDVAGVKNFN